MVRASLCLVAAAVLTGVNGERSVRQAGAKWVPKPGITWQWQLSAPIQTPGLIPVDTSFDVDVYDVDLFFTAQADIDKLKAKNIKVICYFSAGTWEPWRWDSHGFPQQVLGRTLQLWEEERYMDIRNITALAPFIRSRLDLAVAKNCDGVEPDNVDTYLSSVNDTGFDITEADQVAYLKFLSNEAHQRGLSIGLKNCLGLVSQLVNYFDWAMNEGCNTLGDAFYNCSLLTPFVDAGKAVIGVEYTDNPDATWDLTYSPPWCERMNEMKFSWLVKDRGLPAKPYYSCQNNILISDNPVFNGELPLSPPSTQGTSPQETNTAEQKPTKSDTATITPCWYVLACMYVMQRLLD